MTDFLEDGAVLDECDDDLELDAVLVFNMCRSIAATRDTVLSATDDGEQSTYIFPRNLDAWEILENLEDAATGSCGIVVELIGVTIVGEFFEALSVRGVSSILRDQSEEAALGDGGDVEIVDQELSQSGFIEGVEIWRSIDQVVIQI